MATGKKDRRASEKKPKSQVPGNQLRRKCKSAEIQPPIDPSFIKQYEKQIDEIRVKELERNREQLREQIKALSAKNVFLLDNLKHSEKELLQLTAYIKEKEIRKDSMIENLHYLLKMTVEQEKKRADELDNFYQKKIKSIYLSMEENVKNTDNTNKERLIAGVVTNSVQMPSALNGQLQEIQNVYQMLITQLLKELDPLAEETLEEYGCQNNSHCGPTDVVNDQTNTNSQVSPLKNRGNISKLTRRLQTNLTNLVNLINNDIMGIREKQQHYAKIEQSKLKLEEQIIAKDQEILALRMEIDKLRKLQSQHVDLTVSQLVNEILSLRKELRSRDEEIDVLKNWASMFSERCQKMNENEDQDLIPKEKLIKILSKNGPRVKSACSLQCVVQNPLLLKKQTKSVSKTAVM